MNACHANSSHIGYMERNTNEYSELFFHCVEILNQYDEQISEETFLEEYFEKNQV